MSSPGKSSAGRPAHPGPGLHTRTRIARNRHLLLRRGGIAALLAVAIVPLATSYSISETWNQKHDINDGFTEAKLFYLSYLVAVAIAAGVMMIPGVPLISILFLTQALNAVLLLAVVPFLWLIAQSREVMGKHLLKGPERIGSGLVLALILVSVLALGVLSLTPA